MEKIAVLIPCYNESLTIGKVVSDFKEVLPEAMIHVYDNNSTDSSDSIAEQAGAIVHREFRQGKGNVIRSMFRDIDAECYIMVDGDDTYPASSAREMANLIFDKKVDMVIGDRLTATYFTENKRKFHNFGNLLMKKLINTIFKAKLTDIMTGYRAFSFMFAKTMPILTNGFEIETEMTIHAIDKNLSVQSIPIEYRDRPEGSFSKLNTVNDGMKVIFTFLSLMKNYKPLIFFGSIALVLLLVAVILGVPVLVEYMNTGLVPRFPTLIVSGFMIIASLQCYISGLMLENACKVSRQQCELAKINLMLHARLPLYHHFSD